MNKNMIFTDTKPHYELLDGLRGVAALIVVCYHIFEGFSFAEITNGAGDGMIHILNHGYLAVDFFFLLWLCSNQDLSTLFFGCFIHLYTFFLLSGY